MAYPFHDPLNRPGIGILTVHDKEHAFRGNRKNFIDLIRKGKEMNVPVSVVTARDLQLSNRRIRAFVYQTDTKTWSEQTVALPTVIYNRIPTRKHELRPAVQKTIQSCLNHPRVHLFNPAFFNKYTLFEWISKSKKTKKYVPATKKLTTSSVLGGMLAQHETVYLKPVRGKAGKGIMRVTKLTLRGRSIYQLTIQTVNRSKALSFSNQELLWNRIKLEMGDEEYIVQQAISLASYKGRPFDLRVLVQKDGQGEWALSGIGARVAGKRSITTHVPRGGTIGEPRKLLIGTFGPQAADSMLNRAQVSALSIARQIEKSSGYTLGEMSLDLGVDTAGQMWFFEANSRPMKFDEPDIRKRSLERIVQYSQFLIRQR